VAAIWTVVVVATGAVATRKKAKTCPAGTVTLAGTPATSGASLASVTTTPPSGAGALSTTRPSVKPPLGMLGRPSRSEIPVWAEAGTGSPAKHAVMAIRAKRESATLERTRGMKLSS
jgi:hypothetical protein